MTVLHYANDFYDHQFERDMTGAFLLIYLEYIFKILRKINRRFDATVAVDPCFFENLPEIDPLCEDLGIVK